MKIRYQKDTCTPMFTAALLTTAKYGILPFATTWIDIEGIMLSEISQEDEDILYDITYMWTL